MIDALFDPVFLVLFALALFVYVVPRALGDRSRTRASLTTTVTPGRRSGDR